MVLRSCSGFLILVSSLSRMRSYSYLVSAAPERSLSLLRLRGSTMDSDLSIALSDIADLNIQHTQLIQMSSLSKNLNLFLYFLRQPSHLKRRFHSFLSSQLIGMLILKKSLSRFSFAAKMSQILKRDIERAQRVQENVINNNYTIEAEAKIRQKVTIESSIEQLENQLRGEIARSIKRSEMKVIYLIKKAEEKYQQLKKESRPHHEIQDYNTLVIECEKARWEFMVQRQAIGFNIKNYELVTTLYKIPPRML